MSARQRDEGLVVIPAFNEAATVGAVLEQLRAVAPELDALVVDDASRDATAACARQHGARVVSHVFNLGYGAALQTGYKVADREGYPFVVQLDADGQHDPADVPRLAAPIRARVADVVIGSRFAGATEYHMGMVRTAGRLFFQRLLVVCGGPRIADPTSGFQALSRPAFRLCCGDFYPVDFPDIDVLLLLHRYTMRIVEVPVRMRESPPARAAMHGGLRDVYYIYKMLLSTFRSRLAPALRSPPEPRAVPADAGEEIGHERTRA